MNLGSQDAGLDATGGAVLSKAGFMPAFSLERTMKNKTLVSKTLIPVAIASILALPLPVMADEQRDRFFKTEKYPVLSLDAQAYTEVDQDTVIITLQATRQSSEQDIVTKALSETVAAVLNQVKKQDKVKVSSGNYYVRPQYDKDGKVTGWQGQSQLLFESTDIAAASELAAKHQDKMPIANVSFAVSKKARFEAEQALMQDAVQVFKQRAQTMVVALGYADFEIKEIQLGSSGGAYRSPKAYVERGLMMAASADTIPIDSGTEDITLSLSGSIYLLDRR